MSLGQETVLDLMAYADGELDGDARKRVEELVASSEEAARMVDEFRTLTACIQISEKSRRVPKSVDRIVDSVMERLPAAPAPVVNEPKVLKFKRAAAAGAVSLVLAMAAGWLMFFRTVPAPTTPVATIQAPTSPTSPASEQQAAAPPPTAPDPQQATASAENADPTGGGVDLEQVESPSHEVNIFYVPAVAAANASSVVVWIGDVSPGGE
jgi:anti-sigma factor RsiW